MPKTTLLLADEHLLVREALQQRLDQTHLFSVVAVAASAQETVLMALQHQPQIALIDIELPGDGSNACQEILEHLSDTNVVLLSTHDWDIYLARAWDCGASVFVVKTATTEELVQILRAVVADKRLFSPTQLERIRVWQQDVVPKIQALTSRQQEVLKLLAAGYTNAEIAHELIVSLKTVESHVGQILAKLEVTSRREVTAWLRHTQVLRP